MQNDVHLSFRESYAIEFLEEDAHLFENQQQHNVFCSTVKNNKENEAFSDWSQLEKFPEIIEETNHHTANNSSKSLCTKCVQVEIEVQKAKITISKLQKRCGEKTSEINRLRLSQKRAQMAKQTLEDILKDMKEKNLISDEGRSILNVNERNT